MHFFVLNTQFMWLLMGTPKELPFNNLQSNWVRFRTQRLRMTLNFPPIWQDQGLEQILFDLAK